MKFLAKISALFFLALAISSTSFAQANRKKSGGTKLLKGGAYAIGFGVGFGSIEQDGLNQSIRAAKAASVATTGEMNSSMEYMAFISFKFATHPIVFQFRPSYYTQTSNGSGTGGNFNYELTGYTVFPLIRYIPLSNDFIDFYLQGGLGYGKLDGKITNGARNVAFTGSSFGLQAGIGADFCFFPEHCLGIEGSYRYLPIVRNVISSGSVLPPDGISTSTAGRELENSAGDDLPTTFNGVTGIITYTFNF